MYFGFAMVMLALGGIGLALWQAGPGVTPVGPGPVGLRGRIRARGWGLVLPLAALCCGAPTSSSHAMVVAAVLAGALITITWPRLAAVAVPFTVLGLAVYGFVLIRWYYLGLPERVPYGLVLAGPYSWRARLVPVQMLIFAAAGLWLLVAVRAPGGGLVQALVGRWLESARRGFELGQALLLIPVVLLAAGLLGPRNWFGATWYTLPLVLISVTAVAVASLMLVFRAPIWAATLAEAGLLFLGAYGILIALFWPAMPGYLYGVVRLDYPVYGPSLGGFPGALVRMDSMHGVILGGGVQGSLLLAAGLWLAPRVIAERRTGPELAARAARLTQRVERLTQTRSDAVDNAAGELRRIERDLHDGAQARLVALGMSLRAAERLFDVDPQAALALVTDAKETSSRALTELRDLVRDIYPPVLADRGLVDAVRALALDAPLPVQVDVDLPGEVELPVASAVYFCVAEALANVAKHAAARTARVQLGYQAGLLRAQITDDGSGGADPARGTGLAGVERRLATFDGILAVSSPAGGPTIVVIEVPCALSSAKTSSC
jgi:signal transduction histidine kinase